MSGRNRNKRAARARSGAAPQHVVDTLQNLVAGLGDQRDKMSYGRYLLPRVIDRVELEAMYRTNWLAAQGGGYSGHRHDAGMGHVEYGAARRCAGADASSGTGVERARQGT